MDEDLYKQMESVMEKEDMHKGWYKLDGYRTRCSTWDEALLMHQAAVDLVKGQSDGI
jgi:hypothetical protein